MSHNYCLKVNPNKKIKVQVALQSGVTFCPLLQSYIQNSSLSEHRTLHLFAALGWFSACIEHVLLGFIVGLW